VDLVISCILRLRRKSIRVKIVVETDMRSVSCPRGQLDQLVFVGFLEGELARCQLSG
jgi:hypothetical protein